MNTASSRPVIDGRVLPDDDTLRFIYENILIPPPFITLFACVLSCSINIFFNLISHKQKDVLATFGKLRRLLRTSKKSHIVQPAQSAMRLRTQPTTRPELSVQPERQTNNATVATHAPSPELLLERDERPDYGMTDSLLQHAARPPRGHTELDAKHNCDEQPPRQRGSNSAGAEDDCASCNNLSFFRDLDSRTGSNAMEESDMGLSTWVSAPVVVEALMATQDQIRQAHQQFIFSYHPIFILLSVTKCFAMIIYVQYYFNDVPSGWRRLCVCGTAYTMSGLLSPVAEYLCGFLLPLDISQEAHVGVVLADDDDGPKNSAFFAELLLSIAQLNLNNLSDVFVQGSTFVCFATVVLPVLIVFCVPGIVMFVWVFIPPWLTFYFVHRYYYHGVNTPKPSGSCRMTAAVASFVVEFFKTFALKVMTLWLLQATLQVSLILGLVFIEEHSYVAALRYEARHQLVHAYHVREMSTFQSICLLSQLFF